MVKYTKIYHFCHKTLKYNVFGPIILNYAPGEFFCWHFYARRRGRNLSMPANGQLVSGEPFLLALWGEGDVIDGNVAALFRPHRCLNCQRKGLVGVGKTNVGLFPDVLVDPVHRSRLPQFFLVTVGDFPNRQLAVAHPVQVVEYPQVASHLVMMILMMIMMMM